jgi:hypothetical protein
MFRDLKKYFKEIFRGFETLKMPESILITS